MPITLRKIFYHLLTIVTLIGLYQNVGKVIEATTWLEFVKGLLFTAFFILGFCHCRDEVKKPCSEE